MKRQLLLLFIFSNILCTPFLKKLEEVTEESCQKEGKKYQETITYKCKTGKSVFTVAKEGDCKTGTWTKTEKCSASEVPVENCDGTPEFTPAKEAVSASCKLGDIDIPFTSKTDCETELEWHEAKCSIDGVTDSNDCTSVGSWTPSGTCTISTINNKTTCEGTKGAWSSPGDTSGNCTITIIEDETTCTSTNGQWKTSEGETEGTCSIAAKATKTKCATVGQWTDGYCSVSGVEESKCKDTPTYNAGSAATAATCKIGDITIPSRTTSDACQVKLTKETVESCSNKDVDNKSDCESAATVEKVKVGECVEDKSSDSNFLKTINLVLFFICLLF